MNNSKKKKFIVIQIDALPHSIVKRFLDKGSCRFMRKLMKKKGYKLHKYNCGIPTGTAHVQAGIMYNDNSMIPGFRFIDKKAKQFISFGSPPRARYAEKRFFSKKKGILEGGSSYSNCYSGGAKRSVMTVSTLTKEMRAKYQRKGIRWFFLFFNPISTARVLYYTAAELLIEAMCILTHPFVRLVTKKRAIFGFRIPVRKFIFNVGLAEIVTTGVIRDIKEGIPKIYANYINFDDIGHLRRPNSLASYFIVRALDRRAKRIYKHAKGKYDFYIMSDHGQVDAIPFKALQGMELKKFVNKCAKVKEFGMPKEKKKEQSLISAVRKQTTSLLKYIFFPITEEQRYRFNFKDKEAIFVVDSCSLAHVYFNHSKERLEQNQIEKKYPKLIEKLANNKYIGIVMVKQDSNIILINGKNKITITKSSAKIKGNNFLKRYGNDNLLIKQLREFSKLKFVGDIVLFGRYENGLAVSFIDHVGAHNGIGGDMSWPFFLSKEKHDFSKTTNAKDLHKIFKEYQ
ncbi:hypothetical protein KY349_03905 [Candidatus Woesearchaeota archaeon]|nr:hypothetical protein [Candidatus Woesearchaeota archaeon]